MLRTVLKLFICLCFTNTLFSQSSVLKTTCPKITHIDTFICNKSVLKVGDKELKPGGNYTVTLKATDGCDSILLINISTNLPLNTALSVTKSDNGFNSGYIEPIFTLGFRHRWSTGDTTRRIQNLKAGTYTDTITDFKGCIDTLTWVLNMVLPFDMPNAFTPNDDGLNDCFNIVANGNPKILTFRIYNRIGHLVYDNESPLTGWDGKIKEQEAASDVYVYWIELDFGNQNILRGRGEVSLIR